MHNKAKKRPLIYKLFIWLLLVIQYSQILSPVVYAVSDATPSASLSTPLPASESASIATNSGETSENATPSALPSISLIASQAAELAIDLSPSPLATPSFVPSPIPSTSPASSPYTPSPSPTVLGSKSDTTAQVTTLPSILNPFAISVSYPFVGNYPVSYGFGQESDLPYVRGMQSLFGVEAHDGIDFVLDEGTPVYASGEGTVIQAGKGVYGLTIIIKHSWGSSYYGHLSQISVSIGEKVELGQQIGLSGNTGVSTAPHLHFGIKPLGANIQNGFHGFIDPLPYLTSLAALNEPTGQDLFLTAATDTLKTTDSFFLPLAESAENLTFELTDPLGERKPVTPEIVSLGTGETAVITPPGIFIPGQYTLSAVDRSGSSDNYEFSWGVLAINFDKSRYQVGDLATIDFAVLDEKGMMVCDADLTLSLSVDSNITTLSTKQGDIQVSPSCSVHDYTQEPDYRTTFRVTKLGEYHVTLSAETANGLYNISDSFSVVANPRISIQRLTATRIYPPAKYPVKIIITPKDDFRGQLVESAPSDFLIEKAILRESNLPLTFVDTPLITQVDDRQLLTWEADLHAGHTYELSYTYDAPDKSPYLDTLGPLTFTQGVQEYLSEDRPWQLAFDAIGMGIATRLSSIGFELQSTSAGVEFTTAVGAPAIDTTVYRSGAASLEVAVTGSAATEGMTYNYATANSADDYYLRAYVNITTLPSALTEIMMFRDSTPSNQASIRLNTNGTLELWNEEDGVQVGSDSLALSTGRWYRLELRVDNTTIASTLLDARIDGISFASGTVNHANGSLTYTLGWTSTSVTGELNFDDVALNNDSATDLNWPGEGRIVHLRPNGDSSNTCSSGSVYTAIDEITPNDATDTVLCDVANDQVAVQLDDTTTAGIPASSEIKLMQVGYRWTGTDTTGAHSVHGRLTVGGAVEAGAAVASTTATYYTNHNSFQNYQATFNDWTPATQVRRVTTTDLDGAIATYRTADATPTNRVSTLWLLVEYVIPEGGRVYSSGFELQSAATGMEWTTATGALDIDTTTFRGGAASLRVQTLSSGTEESLSQTIEYANSVGPYFARTYIYITTAPSAENRILELKNSSGTVIAYLTLDNTRVLKLYDEDGQITGTSTIPASTWTRLEIKLDATGAGATDTVEGRVDGNIFATSSSRNLSTGITALVIGGNLNAEAQTTGDWYFDDVAVNEKGLGAYQTDYPGSGKITHLRPNATGDTGAWAVNVVGCTTTDYQCIDEITPNDATDAVGTTTNSQIEDVNLDSAATAGINYYDQINVVSVSARAANSSTTQNDLRLRLKSAASAPTVESENILTNSTSYATGRTGLAGTYPLTVYSKPLINTPWTAADLDVAQIGLREQVDSASNLAVTAAWMLVEYDTPLGGRLYSSGYELNSASAGVEWGAVSGSPTVQGTTYRSGTYAGQITSLSSATPQYFGHRFNLSSVNGTYFLRTYLRIATAPSAENRFIGVYDTAGVVRAYLTLNNSRQLSLYDEDGAIGSASSALSADTWYRVELKLDLTLAGGSQVVEAKIDGASAFATSSTRNISTGVAQFRLGGNLNSEAQTTGNWYYDDIALNQNAGSSQNSYPGDGKIVHLKPNADGDTVAWTNTYTNIDEVTPNDATDMVESTTLDQIEEVNLEASSTPGISASDTINLASVGVRYRNDSPIHYSSFRVRLKDAGSATQIMQSDGIPTFSDTWESNMYEEPLGGTQLLTSPLTAYKRPDGTNSWTTSTLDSTQIGVQLAYDYNANNVEVSTLWLLVDYSPPAAITISGTANGNNGSSIRYAYNGTIQSDTSDTISGGTWSIDNVTAPSVNDIITVWVDGATLGNESTAVTKWSLGNATGMVLDSNVLTIGSSQNTGLTVTNLNSYDCSEDEDVMHQAASSHLKVSGDSCAGAETNTYTAPELEILSGNTLTIDTSETLTTYDLTITGTLTSSGNATYNVARNWAKTGTFTSSTSTVNLTGADSSTQTLSGSTSFNNLVISTSSNSAGRTVTFTGSTTTTVTGTWTVTGYSGKVVTLQSSDTNAWTINPTAASVTYVSVSRSTNTGTSFCANYSTDGNNNTGWNITANPTCPVPADSGYSFQRKTWWDGSRYWRSYLNTTDNRIQFEYSSDGASWTEDTSARIATDTTDFSIYADSSNAFIVYTNGYDIEARKASSYPGTGFSWGSATIAYDGTGSSDYYHYPTLAYDSNSKIWVSASYYATGTITNKAVAASSDDADETLGGTYEDTNTTTDIGGLSSGTASSNYYHGSRFTSISIPPKAVISTAKVDWQNAWGTTPYQDEKAVLYFEASDNAATFSSSSKLSSRTLTSNSSLWSGSGSESISVGTWFSATTNFKPPELSSALQEVVNRSGWSSGNSVALIATPYSSGTDGYYFTSYTYDHASSGNEPRLNVTWTASQIMAKQTSSANDISTWGTNNILDASTNTNKYSTIVPRASGAVYATWVDGTAIEGKNFNGTSWDSSPTSIDTGLSGLTKTISATSDSSGNVYLTYVDDETTDQISARSFNGTSWSAQALVPDAASATDAYPTITLDTTNTKVYVFWVDTSTSYIAYSSCTTSTGCDADSEWVAETSWKTTGTNTYLTSNFSGAAKVYAEWLDGTTLTWDILSLGGNTSPNNPSSMVQKTTGDVTLATGDWISATSIKFTASVSDPDASDTLYLCVEKDILGTAFSNTEDSCGTGVAYSGSPVAVSVTISSQTDASEYHWQARVKDAASAYSSWVSYDVNAESARDYGLDTTAPTGGTVYDGTGVGVDTTYNDGSLSSLSANWASFDSNTSGLNKYQYSIGTTVGGVDIKAWTDNGTSASVTATSLTLNSSTPYYINVRAIDNAGNTGSTVSSNGQMVAPSISFAVSPASVTFANLNSGNSYTDTKNTTLTTSTNAYNGYVIRAFVTDYLRSNVGSFTIPDFNGGSYTTPGTWAGAETGFGYTSSDTTIGGTNKFGTGTLYAPFSQTKPGDIVADHTTTVSGTPISNEAFTITYKVKAPTLQEAKNYSTTVVYTATAQY